MVTQGRARDRLLRSARFAAYRRAEHIRAAVLCGLGISQAPFWLLAEEIRSGQVQVLLPELQPERVPIHLVYPAGRRVPMRVRVLIDYLVAAFQ
jgi:DNA-binding transcriptional LysR family regulator